MSVWGDIRKRAEDKQERIEDKFYINVGTTSEILIDIYKSVRQDRVKPRLIQVR